MSSSSPVDRKPAGLVLVVEDDPDTRKLLERALDREGFEVKAACRGDEGLALARTGQFDLILTDIVMPGLDGYQVCQAIKSNPGTQLTPVVMMTGMKDDAGRLRGIEVGADDFIKKPFDLIELVARAHSLVRVKRLTDALESAEKVVYAMARAVEARDAATEQHIQRVCTLAVELGRRLGLAEDDLRALEQGSKLHDLGKLGVSDDILLKPGYLSREEFERMKQHVLIGEQIVRELKSLRYALNIIRHHHERFDGTGYPDGLAGEAIPLDARILSVVDAYDAMTSDRPYRPAMSHGEAIASLRAGAGAQWDPRIVETFIEMLEEQ